MIISLAHYVFIEILLKANMIIQYGVFQLYMIFFVLFIGVNKSKIKKENILSDTVVDWCAGSFMLIHALSFLNVNGFDQKYFMYCEDIDLCMRLKLSGVDLYYTPHFDAIHYAQHENRRIFTKAFRWHIRSITRYILRKPILSYKTIEKLHPNW